MPHYQRQGSVPPQRHIVHRREGRLTYEELVSRRGFSAEYANFYHLNPPTAVREVGPLELLPRTPLADAVHRPRHLRSGRLPAGGDFLGGRRLLAWNADVALSTCEPLARPDWFYRNALADELVFVHHGAGTLHAVQGDLDFGPGDYLVIPRGTTHRWTFAPGRVKLLVVETAGPLEAPAHYRGPGGQLLEQAPYCERDLRVPRLQDARDERGAFPVRIKLGEKLQTLVLAHHPCDLVGWDGCCYPWALNIRDFMPAVGKVHLPPPVHQTFAAPGLVVCSFVPRPFDFHPQAVPIPYAHSNLDSDEVLYYVAGNFMSRRGIEPESLTLHPLGTPHGPQPGLLELSLGAAGTEELAVMVDTFAPLRLAADAAEADDPDYPLSWLGDAT